MPRDLRIALTGLGILSIALGIGRFVLTPLLPLMHEDAGLSLLGGGWLASLNNLGYLIGALGCTLFALHPRTALRGGLLTVALTTLGMGLTPHLSAWLALRLLTGIASAVLVVHGIAFALSRLRNGGHRGLEALVFIGPGVGIVVSGALVAALRPLGLTSAEAWAGFGLLSLLLTGLVWRVVSLPAAPRAAESTRVLPPSGPAWTLLGTYALLGFGYVIPATFLPLIADQHLHLPALREWFWPLYGSATVLVTLCLPWLPRRTPRRHALAACCASMLAGVLLCVLWPTLGGLLLGTVLIGGVTMPVVLLVMDEARRLAPHDPTRLIAALTAGFSVGQIVGPLGAAALAQHRHGFTAPLLLAAIAIALALGLNFVGLAQRRSAHGAPLRPCTQAGTRLR